MSTRSCWMSSWLWIWRFVPTGSCWRERSRGLLTMSSQWVDSTHKSDTQLIITILFVSAGCVSPPAPRPSKWQQVAPPRQLTLDRSTTAARTLPPRGAAPTTPTARPPASQVEPWPALASPSRPQPADGSPWTRWTWRGSMSEWATNQMRWDE